MENNLKVISEPYSINDDFSIFYNGLLACNNIKGIKLYECTKSSIIVRLELKINLPCRRSSMDVDIREVEPIHLLCSINEIRYKAPIVFSGRADFPAEKLPHTQATVDFPAYICLHRGSIYDWYVEHSVEDFINRIRKWFSDAATGNLIRLGDDFEPMLLYDAKGNVVYSYDKLTEFIETYWKNNNGISDFAYTICCFTNKEEAELLNLGKDSFAVQIIDIAERKQLSSLLQKYNTVLTQKNSSHFVGIVGWCDERSHFSKYIKLTHMNLDELYKFNENLGIDFRRALNILKYKNIPNRLLLLFSN